MTAVGTSDSSSFMIDLSTIGIVPAVPKILEIITELVLILRLINMCSGVPQGSIFSPCCDMQIYNMHCIGAQ